MRKQMLLMMVKETKVEIIFNFKIIIMKRRINK